MLKRELRLPARVLFDNPCYFKSDKLVVKFGLNRLGYSRFGVVISKKTAKNATHRNRSKRLVRSRIEDSLGRIKKGYDYLIIIKRNLADIHKEEITKMIDALPIYK